VPCVLPSACTTARYYSTVLLDVNGRRTACPADTAREGRKISTMASQESNRSVASHCMITIRLWLMADRLHRCTEHILMFSLVDLGTGLLANPNDSRPAAGCCASLVVCVAHTVLVELPRHQFAPC
jgi:hypothetical protein